MSEHVVAPHRLALLESAKQGDGDPEPLDSSGQLAFAAKAVPREMRRAALVGRLGLAEEQGPTGDAQRLPPSGLSRAGAPVGRARGGRP